MAGLGVSTQMQTLLKPAEPALAEQYFQQVAYLLNNLHSSNVPVIGGRTSGVVVTSICCVLQLIQHLGVDLEVRNTPDGKGRGVFTKQVPSIRHLPRIASLLQHSQMCIVCSMVLPATSILQSKYPSWRSCRLVVSCPYNLESIVGTRGACLHNSHL